MKLFGKELGFWKDNKPATTEKADIALNRTTPQDLRPTMDLLQISGSEGVRIPWYPLPMRTLYEIAQFSDIVRNVFHSLRVELFRHGGRIRPKFIKKCVACGKEFKKKSIEKCDNKKCGGTEFKEPDQEERDRLEKFIKRVNNNGQNIIILYQTVNEDLETLDDGYIILAKTYLLDGEDKIVDGADGRPVGRVEEAVRGHPFFMRIIADKGGAPGRNDKGEKMYTCLLHRKTMWEGEGKTCALCGNKGYNVHFKSEGIDGTQLYYIEGEVIHTSKYMPSLTFGFPPLLSCWQKIVTLINEDKYIKDYYTRQRPPRGMLFVNTSNRDSLAKAWDWMMDMFRKNPHFIHPFAIESPAGGKSFVEFVDFMRSLEDMQFTEVRDEFRKAIASVFGVMPLYQGQGSEGVSNEGMQIVVTTRAVEHGQGVINENLSPPLLHELNINDWEYVLTHPEFRDEMTKEQVQGQKILNALNMKALGYDVKMDEDGTFEYIARKEIPALPSSEQETPNQPPKSTATGMPEQIGMPHDQRFAGEPPHTHQGEGQRMSGEGQDVRREDLKRNEDYPEFEKGVTDYFCKEFEELKKMEDSNAILKDSDLFELKFLAENMYRGNFEGMNSVQSNRIKKYIMTATQAAKSIDRIVDYILRTAGKTVTPEKAEMIARTESTAMQNKAREWSYLKMDPEQKKLYKWIGPADSRVTDTCARIKARTARGVSMEELRRIVKDESEKSMGHGWLQRDWVPHYGCRHTFTRMV